MASNLFPDSGTRLVQRANGDWAVNGLIVYYRDPAGQNRAPVYVNRGTDTPVETDLLLNSEARLNINGSQLDFRGPPDDTRLLYASVDGGPIFPVPCDPLPLLAKAEARLAELEAAVAELVANGGGGGGGGATSPFTFDPATGHVLVDTSAPGITEDPVTGHILVDDAVVPGVTYDPVTGHLTVTTAN